MTVIRALLVLITVVVLLAPLSLPAQQVPRTARIGWIAGGPGPLPTPAYLEAFRTGMRERGWIEGQNLVIEARWGGREQAEEFAAELVQLKVDVIVTQGAMARGARHGAKSVPIVFSFSGDPIEAQLVQSLARPGGTVTGVTLLGFELVGKRLELLKEAVPGVTRVAIVSNPAHGGERRELQESRAAAQRLGLTVQYLPVHAVRDFDAAFEAMVRERAQAIVALPDGLIMSQARAIAEFGERRRIPTVSGWSEFLEAGNLMTYGPNLRESFRQVAGYVDKILKGTRPGDLPVELPTRFEFTLNLKAAKALGLSLPPSLLLRADRVIE